MNFFWKVGRILGHRGCRPLAKLFEIVNMVIYSNCISVYADIGKRTKFMHHGLGTTVHAKAKIGENCIIFQNVTLGSKWPNGVCENEAPAIGNNCLVGAGACVLGNIKIGDNCLIGANCVVNKNIPSNSLVVGNPFKIIKRRGI